MRPTPAQCALLASAAERMYTGLGNDQPTLDPEVAKSWHLVGYFNARDALLGAQKIDLGFRSYYGFVAVSPEDPMQYIAVVRGTENLAEWLIDAECLLVKHPARGLVEHGFWSVYASMDFVHVGANVGSYAHLGIKGLLPDNAHVEVIGHSLGSAVATYLMTDLAEDDVRVSATLFASPKPGDRAFVNYVDTMVPEYTVYDYAEDVVPTLPPSGLLGKLGWGYQHLPRRHVLHALNSHAEIDGSLKCRHSAISYAAMLDPDIELPLNHCVLERS